MPLLLSLLPWAAGALGIGVVAKTAGDEIGEGVANSIPLFVGAAALYLVARKQGWI